MLSKNVFIKKNNLESLDINEQNRLYYTYQNDYYFKVSIGGRKNIITEPFLLQETGFYLLQEDNSKIKLEKN